MDDAVSTGRLDSLEFELTLFSRHYLGSVARRNQTLDRSAYSILSRLELDDAMSLRELSDAFRLDVSTVNRQVHAMLDRGFVEIARDPSGGAARKFTATQSGLDALHADREQSRAGLGRLLSTWDAADVSAFASMLERFNRQIEGAEGSQWPRPVA